MAGSLDSPSALQLARLTRCHCLWGIKIQFLGTHTEGRPSNSSSRRDSALGRRRLQLRKAILRSHTPSYTVSAYLLSTRMPTFKISPSLFQARGCSRLFEAFRFTFGLSSTLHGPGLSMPLLLLPPGLEAQQQHTQILTRIVRPSGPQASVCIVQTIRENFGEPVKMSGLGAVLGSTNGPWERKGGCTSHAKRL